MSEPGGSPKAALRLALLARSGHFSLHVARLERAFGSLESEMKASRNGGGGSRTRVRKHVAAGLYMRVRFRNLMPDVRKRRKTAGHQARFNLTATRRAATWPPACLMAFDPQPPGEVKANVTAY
jgi:hypothetical protein